MLLGHLEHLSITLLLNVQLHVVLCGFHSCTTAAAAAATATVTAAAAGSALVVTPVPSPEHHPDVLLRPEHQHHRLHRDAVPHFVVLHNLSNRALDHPPAMQAGVDHTHHVCGGHPHHVHEQQVDGVQGLLLQSHAGPVFGEVPGLIAVQDAVKGTAW